MVAELPGLGVNGDAAVESRSRALSHLTVIVESLVRTCGADALTNVSQAVPALPEPAVLERVDDKRPVRLDERILRLLSGEEKFYHRNTLREFLARFIQVTVPAAPSDPSEHLRLDEAAASAG